MKKNLLCLLCCLLCVGGFAQKEWSNWYFDGADMVTFKNGHPEVVHNFIDSISPDNFNYYHYGHGGISYSDPVTGEVKFIIADNRGYDKNFEPFPKNTDTVLRACNDRFAYHIAPFHNNPNKFYIIQFQNYFNDLYQLESGLQVQCRFAIGLGYSIVDLSENNGLGDFTQMNRQLISQVDGEMTTVHHSNGQDVWVIVHPHNSNQFNAYLFTDAGVQPAVTSYIGPYISGSYRVVSGVMTASSDGKMLAGYETADDNLQLFDFDNSTGLLSNYRTLAHTGTAQKLQFSPDNSKLYYLDYYGLYQYDLNKADISASATKVYQDPSNLMYDMQLAPDGKIYVTKTTTFSIDGYTEYLGAVECPNLPQYACNFNATAVRFTAIQFSDLVNDLIKEQKQPDIPKFSLGQDTAICFGNYDISAPAGWGTYRWNTGDTTQKISVTKAGLYYVLAGGTGFDCAEAYGYVNVTDKAIKLNLGKDTALCPGTQYTLHVPSGYTGIQWQNGSHARDSLFKSGGGAVIITANDPNGCLTRDTIGVYYNNNLSANFGPDTTLCTNASLKLSLYPLSNFFFSGIYKWQDGSTLDTLTVTKSGTYWGEVTYQGCTVSDTININFINAANVYLGRDTTLCIGDSLKLQSNISNAKYRWSTGDTTSSVYVKSAGNYSLTVREGGCAASDAVQVSFKPKPVFSLGADTSICDRDNLVLNPGLAGGSFLWQDGSNNSNFNVTSSGMYWLQFTQNGCAARDSIAVMVDLLPVINLGKDTGICKGQNVLLDAFNPGAAIYRWQDGSNNSKYTVTNNGVYSVKITGSNGCTYSDTIKVTVSTPPAFSLGADTVLCDNESLPFYFNLPNVSYQWNDGSLGNTYTIRAAGMYTLSVSQNGCSSADTINVAFKPIPVVNLGPDTTVCQGVSLLLQAQNAGATYRWQDRSTLATYTVTNPGVYYVNADINGCDKADTVTVYYKTKPAFTLGNDTLLCNGQQLLLNPAMEGAVSYKWQDGTAAQQYTVTKQGIYTLQATNECGITSDTIEVAASTCILEMPTAFTPNRDGHNDIFKVKYPGFIRQFHMVVFNRWGQKIFETTDARSGWDGTLNGMPQDMGAYIWLIQLTDITNKTQSAQGTVTLIK